MRIRLSTPVPDQQVTRMTPTGARAPECSFTETSDEGPMADGWVVFESNNSPQECTTAGAVVLVTAEPPSTREYPKEYLQQFDHVLTPRLDVEHAGAVLMHQLLPWHVGIAKVDAIWHQVTEVQMSYADFAEQQFTNKSKAMSVVTSTKAISPGHELRLSFIERMKAEFGNEIDFFGAGSNHIADKWDAVRPYRYHVALENCRYPGYFTEKLSDSFLGGALPVYYGAPDVADYFSAESMEVIDLDEQDEALRAIETLLRLDPFEERLAAIEESRERVLHRYNMMVVLSEFLVSLPTSLREPIKRKVAPIETFR